MSNRHTYSKREHALQVRKNDWISKKSMFFRGFFLFFVAEIHNFSFKKTTPLMEPDPSPNKAEVAANPGTLLRYLILSSRLGTPLGKLSVIPLNYLSKNGPNFVMAFLTSMGSKTICCTPISSTGTGI